MFAGAAVAMDIGLFAQTMSLSTRADCVNDIINPTSDGGSLWRAGKHWRHMVKDKVARNKHMGAQFSAAWPAFNCDDREAARLLGASVVTHVHRTKTKAAKAGRDDALAALFREWGPRVWCAKPNCACACIAHRRTALHWAMCWALPKTAAVLVAMYPADICGPHRLQANSGYVGPRYRAAVDIGAVTPAQRAARCTPTPRGPLLVDWRVDANDPRRAEMFAAVGAAPCSFLDAPSGRRVQRSASLPRLDL
jgi:hypothetical protein